MPITGAEVIHNTYSQRDSYKVLFCE